MISRFAVSEELSYRRNVVLVIVLIKLSLIRAFTLILAPRNPRNIRVQNETDASFWLIWEPPALINSSNDLVYEITTQKFPPKYDGQGKLVDKITKFTVNGSITMIEIMKATIGFHDKIQIMILARSPGGPSSGEIVVFKVKGKSRNYSELGLRLGIFRT
jgi:hypothetical protein